MSDTALLHATLASAQASLTGGEPVQGLEAARHAGQLAATAHDARAAAEALRLAAHHLYMLGRYREALDEARRAARACRSSGLEEPCCDALLLAAVCLSENGLHDAALSVSRKVFEAARRRMLPEMLIRALSLMGLVHGRLGDWEAGETLLLQALSRARDGQDEASVKRVLNTLLALLLRAEDTCTREGRLEARAGVRARIEVPARRALALCRDDSDRARRLVLLSNAAHGLMVSGLTAEALQALQDCADEAAAYGMEGLVRRARFLRALALQAAGRRPEALDELRQLHDSLPANVAELTRWTVTDALASAEADAGQGARAVALRQSQVTLEAAMDEQRLSRRAALEANAQEVLSELGTLEAEWVDSQRG